ncbi:hypothetical protein [Polaromonas sp.]|uniref:hypothetical protein n=1 Tax=Polaromonas sp. TaxID=1869339 RepID=UPI0037530128
MNIRKTLLTTVSAALLAGAAALSAGPALAHGAAAAQHGGVVQTAADLSFELVATPGGAALYLEDHNKALQSVGLSGKLTVLNGTVKSEAELQPAGGNKLEARGVKLNKGAKVVAVLNMGKKPVTVRFTVK